MKEFFPYKTIAGDATLDVTSARIDGVDVPTAIWRDANIVAVRSIEKDDWEELVLHFSLHAPASEVTTLVAPQATVVLNCSPSNTRQSTQLSPQPGGLWTGQIRIFRPFWFGSAEIRGGVVASVDGTDHRVVGWAEPWSLQLDDLPNRPPVGGAIHISWVSFSESVNEMAFLAGHEKKPYYLRLDGNEPQLLLNSGFEGLPSLLEDRKNRKGPDKALHDVTRSAIADKTWVALFNVAIDNVEVDEDGEVSWPVVTWQQEVLKSMLASMYPGQSLDQALRDAYAAHNDAGSSSTMLERLGPVANTQANFPKLLGDSIRRVVEVVDPNEGEEEE